MNCTLRHVIHFNPKIYPDAKKPFELILPERLFVDGKQIHIPSDNNYSLNNYVSQVGWFIDQSTLFLPYSGFSAEDDPKYDKEKLDTKFFNPDLSLDHPNQGQIRVALLPKFLQAMTFAYTEAVNHYRQTQDESTLVAFQSYAVALLYHELNHAAQYHLYPVTDILVGDEKGDKNCPEGLCDPDLIRATNIKIFYEEQAYQINVTISSAMKEEMAAAGQFLLDFEEKNPNLFEPGAKFYLLSKNYKNPFHEYYLTNVALHGDQVLNEKGRFFLGKDYYINYCSQNIPAQLVWDIVGLKKKLNDNNITKDSAEILLEKLKEQLLVFTVNNNGDKSFKAIKLWPYLAPIGDRFWKEYDEIKAMLK